MIKRILFGGVLAVALVFGLAGSAQAQHHGGHHGHPSHHGHGYGHGYHSYHSYHGHGHFYPQTVYRPVLVSPGLPFAGYGNSVFAPPAVYNSFPYAGYGTYGGIRYVTPGLSIGIGIRR